MEKTPNLTGSRLAAALPLVGSAASTGLAPCELLLNPTFSISHGTFGHAIGTKKGNIFFRIRWRPCKGVSTYIDIEDIPARSVYSGSTSTAPTTI